MYFTIDYYTRTYNTTCVWKICNLTTCTHIYLYKAAIACYVKTYKLFRFQSTLFIAYLFIYFFTSNSFSLCFRFEYVKKSKIGFHTILNKKQPFYSKILINLERIITYVFKLFFISRHITTAS